MNKRFTEVNETILDVVVNYLTKSIVIFVLL